MVPTQWQEPFLHTAPVYPPHSPRVKQRSPSSASANLNNRRLTCFLNHIYQRKNCHNVVFVSSVVGCCFFFKYGFNKRKCNFGLKVSLNYLLWFSSKFNVTERNAMNTIRLSKLKFHKFYAKNDLQGYFLLNL